MVIGTDPTVRGKGFGDLLPYYQRSGFEVTGEIKLPKVGPSMWPTWREVR